MIVQVNNNQNQVVVIQQQLETVEVNSIGPKGDKGSKGDKGDTGDSFIPTGSLSLTGSLSATGNISSSAKVSGLTGSFGRLEGLSPITVGDIVIFQQAVSGSVFSGSFIGDGSGMSGVVASSTLAQILTNGNTTSGNDINISTTDSLNFGGDLFISGSSSTLHLYTTDGAKVELSDTIYIDGDIGLAPKFDNKNVLGESGRRWSNIYAVTISGSFIGDGSGLTGISTGGGSNFAVPLTITNFSDTTSVNTAIGAYTNRAYYTSFRIDGTTTIKNQGLKVHSLSATAGARMYGSLYKYNISTNNLELIAVMPTEIDVDSATGVVGWQFVNYSQPIVLESGIYFSRLICNATFQLGIPNTTYMNSTLGVLGTGTNTSFIYGYYTLTVPYDFGSTPTSIPFTDLTKGNNVTYAVPSGLFYTITI